MTTDFQNDPIIGNEPSETGFDPELEKTAEKVEEVVKAAETAAKAAEAQNDGEGTPYTTPDAASAPEPQAVYAQDPFPYESVPHFGNAPQYTAQAEPPQSGREEAPNYSAYQSYGPNASQQQYYYQPYQPPYYPPRYDVPPVGYLQKSRLAAGLLGILFGGLGVHNFYLGFQTKAVVQLLVTLIGSIFTCGLSAVAMSIWGFVEGILILTANNPSARMYDGKGVILRD